MYPFSQARTGPLVGGVGWRQLLSEWAKAHEVRAASPVIIPTMRRAEGDGAYLPQGWKLDRVGGGVFGRTILNKTMRPAVAVLHAS